MTAGVLGTAAVLSLWSGVARAAPADSTASKTLPILDVPYVPQGEALCGGAALAMVLRYWGERAVLAEDFASLLGAGEAGIRADELVAVVRARGWTALPVRGTTSEVQDHLTHGRPVIALIRVSPRAFHYVVLVAWANGGVLVHDPALGPFRFRREADFDAAWRGSARWALIVLPPAPHAQSPLAAIPEAAPRPALAGCDALVDEGIRQAEAGDTTGAESRFEAARALCPAAAAPLEELAGLRFRARDWAGAARLADLALERAPGDAHTLRLVAGSRFLAGDVPGALEAWNQLAEPRADLTRIDGLVRVRYDVVAGRISLPPGRLVTPRAFQLAQRRLDELPAGVQSRLSLKPQSGGVAQLDAALLERPLLFAGPWDAGGAGLRAVIDRELTLNLASPTGQGELWTASWRSWRERPRVVLALAIPAGVRPGTWRVEGSWERQSYAQPVTADVLLEERRRAAISFADWAGPNVRVEIGAALDRWSNRGTYVSSAAKLETRWLADRIVVGADVAQWATTSGGAPFQSGSLLARWVSGAQAQGGWRARGGIAGVTASAPRALWPGAGTGSGRPVLLRAHPLLDGGVVSGPVFGQTLVHGGLERVGWALSIAPLRLGWALFVDVARAEDPWQVDAGLGLRLAGLGSRGAFRVDLAHGMTDGRNALSVGWESR